VRPYRNPDLPKVVLAGRLTGRLTRELDGRQKQYHQNGEDANDNQKFDQSDGST
jgi:hypothetical protein